MTEKKEKGFSAGCGRVLWTLPGKMVRWARSGTGNPVIRYCRYTLLCCLTVRFFFNLVEKLLFRLSLFL